MLPRELHEREDKMANQRNQRQLAVVTGAGSGIGRACAKLLAQRAFTVVCIGRRKNFLEETIKELKVLGGGGVLVQADITTQQGIETIRQMIDGQEIGALVHAAGQELIAPFLATTRMQFEEVMATNLAGPFFLTQALVPLLNEGAGVVFLSSIAALVGRDRHAAYGVSKAALVGLIKNLAAELGPRIRVNGVYLGATNTAMLQQNLSEYIGSPPSEEAMQIMLGEQKRLLLGRVAEPDEMASTIIHLTLDATAMTGSMVNVDLGYTAR